MTIPRYDISNSRGDENFSQDLALNGDWCKWEDVQGEIAEAQEQLVEHGRTISRLRQELQAVTTALDELPQRLDDTLPLPAQIASLSEPLFERDRLERVIEELTDEITRYQRIVGSVAQDHGFVLGKPGDPSCASCGMLQELHAGGK